jgi:hypothetical protein
MSSAVFCKYATSHERDFRESLKIFPWGVGYMVLLLGVAELVQASGSAVLFCIAGILLFPACLVGAFAMLGIVMPIIFGIEWITKGFQFKDDP